MFRFCWHDWGKWSGIIKDYNGYRKQYRSCKKCNKIIKRTAFHLVETSDEDVNERCKNATK